MGKSSITFGNVGVTLKLNCTTGISQVAHVSVTLGNSLQVPACSEVEVIADIPDIVLGGARITEGTSSTRLALSVTRMLVLPASKSVPVRLPNTRVNLAKPHRGTVGAQMEFVKIDNPFVGSAQLTGSTSEPTTQSIQSVTNQLGNTNHGSLSWLSNFENLEGQIGNTDVMSTRPCYQSGRHDHITKEDLDAYSVQQTPGHTDQDFRKLQFDDSYIGFAFKAEEENKSSPSEVIKGQNLSIRRLTVFQPKLQIQDEMLWRNYKDAQTKQEWKQLIDLHSLREKSSEKIHAGIRGGHLGDDNTLQELKKRFYGPGHFQDRKTLCQACLVCASGKTRALKNCAPLQPVSTGSPIQVIAIDIMGPLPESMQRISYVADYFTTWMEVLPKHNQEGLTIAKKLVDKVLCRFKNLKQLHLNKGKQFEGRLRKLHCPWKGPHRIVKISDCDYHTKSWTTQFKQIVHFNRLKLFKPGTCKMLQENQSPPSDVPNNAQTPLDTVGENLELVECDTHRPSRALCRFTDFVSSQLDSTGRTL